MKAEILKGHLDAVMLAIVAEGPAHGYSIIERIKERSGGLIELGEGTAYPALHRLERQGYLKSRWGKVGGRRRRVYELTSEGRRALQEHEREWKDFARAIGSFLGPKPGTVAQAGLA